MSREILVLSREVSDIATAKIGEIQRVTALTRLLALNAMIEAKRAGEAGSYTDRGRNLIGFALTPGYETYRGLGWYGVLIQSRQRDKITDGPAIPA